jgi:hypothetical protein
LQAETSKQNTYLSSTLAAKKCETFSKLEVTFFQICEKLFFLSPQFIIFAQLKQ